MMTKNENSTHDTTPSNKLKIQQRQTQLSNKLKMEKQLEIKELKANMKVLQNQVRILNLNDFSILFLNPKDEKLLILYEIKTFFESLKNGNYSKDEVWIMYLRVEKLRRTCQNYKHQHRNRGFQGALYVLNMLGETLMGFITLYDEVKDTEKLVFNRYLRGFMGNPAFLSA